MKKTVIKRRKRVPAVGQPAQAAQKAPPAGQLDPAVDTPIAEKETRGRGESVVLAEVDSPSAAAAAAAARSKSTSQSRKTPAGAISAQHEHERLGQEYASHIGRDLPRHNEDDRELKLDSGVTIDRSSYNMTPSELQTSRQQERERGSLRFGERELDRERERRNELHREREALKERGRELERDREVARQREREHQERERQRQKEREGVSAVVVRLKPFDTNLPHLSHAARTSDCRGDSAVHPSSKQPLR
jgi:hypothetical protein